MEIAVSGETRAALVDTGASVSLISEDLIPQGIKLKRFSNDVRDASGNKIPILGKIGVCLKTQEGILRESMLVFENKGQLSIDIIIGMNILSSATLNLREKTLKFEETGNVGEDLGELLLTMISNKITNKNGKYVNQGIYTESDKERETQESQLEELEELVKEEDGSKKKTGTTRDSGDAVEANPEGKDHVDEVVSEDVMKSTNEMQEHNIHLLDDLKLKGNAVTITRVRINGNHEKKTLVLNHAELKQRVVCANVLTTVNNGAAWINVINLNDTEVLLPQGTKIGIATRHEEETVREVTVETKNKEKKEYRKLRKEDVTCGDEEMEGELLSLLNKNRKACWLPGESLGLYKGEPLEINLKEPVIVNKAPYRIPHAKQKKLDKTIADMLSEGVITRSKSSFNSPLIIVEKPNGEIRPCIDYRALNEMTIPVTFPIPRISDLLNSLGKSNIISSLDLASAYHQCSIREEDREKTAFTVGNTRYEFTRVPFGLTSAPGYFSRIINQTLFPLLGEHVLCYLDDILIFSKTKREHLKKIEQVLERLVEANIKLKLEKCKFFTQEEKFLGYIVSGEGMKMDENRVNSINEMPYPRTKKQLQALLGVYNYFRMFVDGYAKIAEPLYELLRKDVKFVFGEPQKLAVDKLKKALSEAPILKFPDFDKKFIIHTDASETGMGACLMQVHEDKLHPISFVSKSLSETQRKYSPTKREALALVFALEQFRHLILCYEVHVYTDHAPLKGILTKRTKDPCLTRWALLVQEYAIQLHYLPGKENIMADVLSRLTPKREDASGIPAELNETLIERVNHTEELNSYIPEKAPWSEEELRRKQKGDKECEKILKTIRQNTEGGKRQLKYKKIKGILFAHRIVKRGKLEDQYLVPYIPDKLMRKAFKLVHEETTAGHRGYENTMRFFRKNFMNVSEATIVKRMCDECESCLKAKASTEKVPIEKYPIPSQPFHTISSDILGPLPITSNGNRFILVVRDFTTRYTILSALGHKDAESIIVALRNVIANYGSSSVLLTDNAKEYVGEKLKNFLKFFNTKKVEIAPYHPSSQGLAERINREINKMLRIFTNNLAINDWDELLPVLQLTINNTHNASIGESPFFVLYGYDSPTIALTQPKINYSETDLNAHLKRITLVRTHCRNELLKAQAKYTEYANEGREGKEIKVGERVYAKLTKHKTHVKLDYPVSGPFVVMSKKGKAFTLKDINSTEKYVVHPDFIIKGKTVANKKIKEDNNEKGRYVLRPRLKEGKSKKN